jgi:hypothetical protein
MQASLRALLAAALIGVAGSATAQGGDVCSASPPQPPAGAGDRKTPPMFFCFDTVRGVPVLWLYGDMGSDSAANVRRGLQQGARYREVWLNSGGGSVAEGYEIGGYLRQIKATVRVPRMNGVTCASSCTNLMLGGYNRIVEDGAKFYVHASSSVMQLEAGGLWVRSGSRDVSIDPQRLLEASAKDPSSFREVAELRQAMEPAATVEMVQYYQSILGGTPNRPLYSQLGSQELPKVYAASRRNLDRDVADLRANGIVALQEVMTQIELDGKRTMLARMREREPELGRGARVALRILEATLACRIQDLCLLTRHQLASLGYHNFDRE